MERHYLDLIDSKSWRLVNLYRAVRNRLASILGKDDVKVNWFVPTSLELGRDLLLKAGLPFLRNRVSRSRRRSPFDACPSPRSFS